MKHLSVAVHAAVGMAAAAALPAFAQSEDESVEEIVVTGTRITRPNLVTSSPVAQLDAEAIELTGVTRIEDALGQMPQVYLDQSSGQSINADGTATVELRLLGVNRTLVLLDGKRLPIASPVANWLGPDLNFIPGALVERVDILTGGASAIYGADAVAGVINFIMKDDFQGVQLNYEVAQYRHDNKGRITAARAAERGFDYATGTANDGDIYDLAIMLGSNINGDRGNITAYGTYRNIDAITQSERDYSACALARGRSACGGSEVNAFGSFFDDTGAVAFNVVGTDFVPYSNARDFNYAPPSYFQRPDERYTLGAFAHYEVSDQITAFTQLMFMNDRTVAQFGPSGFFFDYGVDIYCDENPLLSAQQIGALGCVSGNGDVAEGVYVGRRNVEGGPRFGDLKHTTYRGVFGISGDINEAWDYEVSYQYGEVDMRFRYENMLNAARIGLALDPVLLDPTDASSDVVCRVTRDVGDASCVPWNIWQTGGVTSAATEYLRQSTVERGTADQSVFTAFARGNLGDYGVRLFSANDGIDVVIGYEHREENLSYSPDENLQAGAIAGSSGTVVPVNGGYKVDDYFFEANVPIVQGRNLVEDLSVELGYRYSDYDTGATSNTYKIAASWSINDQIMLRGSYQRAVREGNIVELFHPIESSGFGLPNGEDPCADVVLVEGISGSGVSGKGFTFAECARSGVSLAVWDAGGPFSSPVGGYNAVNGGNAGLDPEESDTYSAGIVLRPNVVEGLNVAVDYYDIEVHDTIGVINPETTLAQCIQSNQFCDKVHRGSGATLWLGAPSLTNGVEALFQNVGSFRVKGLDMEATYTFGVGGLGSMNLANVLSWTELWTAEAYAGAGAIDCVGVYGGPCGPAGPEVRNRFTASWTTPWNFLVQATWRYTSEVDQIESDFPVDIDNFNYVDLAGIWAVTKWLEARAGVNNLFDVDPPVIDDGAFGGNGNTLPAAYDHLGQYWFLGASVQF